MAKQDSRWRENKRYAIGEGTIFIWVSASEANGWRTDINFLSNNAPKGAGSTNIYSKWYKDYKAAINHAVGWKRKLKLK